MKSLIKIIILTSLFTSLTSAIYEAGRACGNNIQCTHNCYNSQYNIASQDGVCNFVCDVSAPNSTRFSSTTCEKRSRTIDPASKFAYDGAATAAACQSLGGIVCPDACVDTASEFGEAEVRGKWSAACKDVGTLLGSFSFLSDLEEATHKAGCH
jgi:hypothetical protein